MTSPSPDTTPTRRRLPLKTILIWGVPSAGALMGCLALSVAAQGLLPGVSLKARVQKAFPNTQITSVTCGKVASLCEVTAGPNVFYVTGDGRYALVGSLLDLKERLDLTDRRIKELAAVDSVTGRLGGAPQAQATDAVPRPQTAQPITITLPRSNAVIHNPGGALKLAAFTDLNCGYCKMMVEALRQSPDIELAEYPMELLKPESAEKAKLALCGQDRAKTAEALYSGGEVRVSGDCKAAAEAVSANTQFARAHGVTGTPTLVRSDGATNSGFMPVDQLRAWLKAAKA